MDNATLEQAARVLTLISQKRVTSDHLQALLSSGLLTDLLEADLSEFTREEFRRLLGFDRIYGVSVYESTSAEGLMESYGLDAKSWPIGLEVFRPTPGPDNVPRQSMTVLRFPRKSSTFHVLRAMSARDLRPATARETYHLLASHRNIKGGLVALGTRLGQPHFEVAHFPVLGVAIGLATGITWPAESRFAAVYTT